MAILENGVKTGNRAETFIRSRTREFVTREREREGSVPSCERSDDSVCGDNASGLQHNT